MFARVNKGIARAGKMDEVIGLAEASLAPRALEQAGCKGVLLLTHAGTRQMISISLWESEEAMLSTESSDYLRQQIERLAPLLEEPAPSTTNFRVSGCWLDL